MGAQVGLDEAQALSGWQDDTRPRSHQRAVAAEVRACRRAGESDP